MAYQIDRYNRSLLTVVEDGTLDETTDLRFIGKNFAGYGEIHNENFLFLLENFANANPPPRALSGQVWFDSASSKLKFYDGSTWRNTGGAAVGTTQPAGLTVGDFWWDSANEQLYVFNGSSFVLIGPQDAGSGLTQLVSQVVARAGGGSEPIIIAFVGDEPIFVISFTQFTLAASETTLTTGGFSLIREGVTLRDTDTAGITSGVFRFHGTASDAKLLDGYSAADFILKSQPDFPDTITSDNGIDITQALKLSSDNTHGVIRNDVEGGEIKFRATSPLNPNDASVSPTTNIHSLSVAYNGMFPAFTYNSGTAAGIDLGNTNRLFRNIWANKLEGTAARSDKLKLKDATTYHELSVQPVPSTVVARSTNNVIFATLFEGTASSATFADLAEKYTTDQEYPIGTIMAVGGEAETTAATAQDIAIGVISENPAYLMNSELEGQALALKGRVPVRVSGTVAKGQAIYAMSDGVGSTLRSTAFVGVALEGSTSAGESLIECVLKV